MFSATYPISPEPSAPAMRMPMAGWNTGVHREVHVRYTSGCASFTAT